MFGSIKKIKKLKLNMFIISDYQEWEAILGVDYNENDFFEYDIKTDLSGNDYILLLKKI